MNLISFTNKHNREMQTFDTNKIKKFNNVDSLDVSEFASKSMDVIVDIHREYKEEKQVENIQQDRKSDNKSADMSSNSQQLFSETYKKNKKSNINLVSRESFGEHNDINVVDSLDLIEEFQEPLVIRKDEQNFELIKENINQSLVKEKSVHRKQWATIKNTVEELKKPPRKRWLKDNSVIRLPEAKNVSWNKTKRSLPAMKQSVTAYDNKAFLSENEEILRIETDYNREDTKIEIKDIADQLEDADLPTVDNISYQNSSVREISNETAMLDDLNRSMNNVVVDNKRFTNFNKTNKKKHSNINNKNNVSDNSNSSQKLEENYSFEETSMKDNQLLNKGKNERNPKQYSVSTSKDDNLRKDHVRHFSQLDEDHSTYSSDCTISTTEDDGDQLTEVHYESKLKSDSRRKKLKHAKHHSRSQNRNNKKEIVDKNVPGSIMHTPSIHIEEDTKKKKRKKKIDAKYISIMIHRADMLVIDYVTKHPMVKVHIVNAENGKYLKRECGATHLQPMITGKFDFKENKSIIPMWEEELIFEHDFEALLKTDSEQVVILFEIVDLLSFTEASFNYDKFGHEGCWYKVAWGFLKPIGRNNVLHTEKKIRLQLYKPQKSLKRFDSPYTCEAYTWWKSNIREKYPSSLYVTVISINPPKLEPVYYQQLTLHDSSKISNETQKTSIRASDLINLPKWTRLAAQSCKIPNETIFETDTSENGCFYIAFSNDGKYLACSFSEEYDYPIVIYEIETKKIHVRFSGHKTFVYSLHWSNDNNYLLSVSSDQTARIWDVLNQIVQYIEMMPHPLYVYCGRFDPENSSIVATGCYDQIARIWIRDKKSKNRDLSQELEGHEGFVNCMCFQKNSNLLTADSVGIIIIWAVKKNRKAPYKKEWHISRKIRVRDMDGVIINTIVLHPLESRLLVHSRNNGLRMLDLATGVVLQKYNELNNQRIQSTACISPCGGLILCGGEDSSLKVWNLETGNLLAKYTFDRNCRAVTCVDYHPYDHVLAYSTFGNPASVKVLRFNKDATGEDVDLKIFVETENAVNSNDIPIRFLNSSVKSRDKLQSNGTEQTPENASKGSLQSSRSYNSSHYKSPNDISDNYNNTRIKLQRLNEIGQTLKSKSASRLYNIIEKIDRILSNTSRSPGDIESGSNLALIQETSANKILTSQNENEEKNRIKSKKNKLAYSSNRIQSNSFVESSTTNSDKQEVVELRTLENWRMERRSKSAKEIRNKNVPKDDIAKTFSDSAANCQESKFNHEIMKNRSGENIESNFVIKTKEHNSKSIVYHKNDYFEDDESNSSHSTTGTYVVDKESTKMLEHRNSILSNTEDELNIMKCSESDSSVPSNATFTIENEIPIPKPRKKISLK